MSKYLHHQSVVKCVACPVRLQFPPAPVRKLTQRGRPHLVESDVKRAIIAGCTQVGSGRTPCTRVVSIARGLCDVVHVGGERAVRDTLEVITNGSPNNRFRFNNDSGAVISKAEDKGWVDVTVTDTAGNPLSNERYKITLPDGSTREGRLDDQGRLKIDGLKPGALAKLRFPDLDGDEPGESA